MWLFWFRADGNKQVASYYRGTPFTLFPVLFLLSSPTETLIRWQSGPRERFTPNQSWTSWTWSFNLQNRENKFLLFKPPNLRCFTMAAQVYYKPLLFRYSSGKRSFFRRQTCNSHLVFNFQGRMGPRNAMQYDLSTTLTGKTNVDILSKQFKPHTSYK